MTKFQQLATGLLLVAILARPAFEYFNRPERIRTLVWLGIAVALAADYWLLYGVPDELSPLLGLN